MSSLETDEVRIGYYSELVTDEETGEQKVVVKAHNPKVQRFFEQQLREGTRRRREAGRQP